MQESSKKYLENLQKAIKEIKIADHMLYVTYPVIQDKRLLLKALDQVYESIIAIINSILQYDSIWKKIILTSEPRVNFEIFIKNCSSRYNINQEELSEVIELITLAESHKKSSVEFPRKNKIIIMTDNLKTNSIDSETLKKYLNLSKKLIDKAKFGMSLV